MNEPTILTVRMLDEGINMTVCMLDEGINMTVCMLDEGINMTVCMLNEGVNLTVCMLDEGSLIPYYRELKAMMVHNITQGRLTMHAGATAPPIKILGGITPPLIQHPP